jgi:hypothetical protein
VDEVKELSRWYGTSKCFSIVGTLILLSSCLLASQAQAPVAFAQEKEKQEKEKDEDSGDRSKGSISLAQENDNEFGSASTASISFKAETTAGDLVIVGIYFGPSSSISSVTDSQTNVYTQIGTALNSPTKKQSAALFYAKKIKGGSDTVTVQLNAVPESPGLGISIFEYKGVDTISPLDGNAQAAGSSRTVSSGNLTTTVAGDLLFGFCVSDSKCHKGEGFKTKDNDDRSIGEYKILDAAGTTSVTASANDPWTIQAAAFKPVGTTVLTTPTAVQHVGSKVTGPYFACFSCGPFNSYSEYDIRFDAPVLSGNAVIVGVSWSASGVTPAVTDDKNNTYLAGPSRSDGNQSVGIWYLLNATNGPRVIQAKFSSPTSVISLIASEFSNIATNSVPDGTSGGAGASGASVATGAISTTADNDLIWQFGVQESGAAMTQWTPATNWTLICPDIQETGQAAQYTVQTSHGSITPALTQSPTTNPWITVAMAFKSAPAGTAPPASQMRVVQHTHTALDNDAPSGSTIETSVTGNLLVLTSIGYTGSMINSITDSAGNTWKDVNPGSLPGVDHSAGAAQIWYAANVSPTAALVITVNFTGFDGKSGTTIHVLDIVNAAPSPLDTVATASGDNSTSTSTVGASITPGTARGIVVFNYTVSYNTVIGSSPSNFIMSTTSPEYEGSLVDNNNGGAVSYHTDTSPIQNTWTSDLPPVSWGEVDASFIERPALQPLIAPGAPANVTAFGSTGETTLNWTATDNAGGARYNIYRSTTAGFAPTPGTRIGEAASTTYKDFVPAGTYYYLVTAQDGAQNVSVPSNEAGARVSADKTAPSAPTNLVAMPISGSGISLTWTPSTDDVAVAGYQVFRNGSPIATSASASYLDTGLSASTTYTYTVTAFDSSRNVSPASQAVNATTGAPSLP